MDRAQSAALVSAGLGLVVLALKFGAWWLTGSLALYSDALESIINVVAAATAFLALRWAAQPADSEHPYGHHKAEYFSAVIEGALIIVAAVLILKDAYAAVQAPAALEMPLVGIAVNGLATVINAVWATMLLKRGRCGARRPSSPTGATSWPTSSPPGACWSGSGSSPRPAGWSSIR